jgi:hypothetical protein
MASNRNPMNERQRTRRTQQWRVYREQTTANGIATAITLLRTGRYPTIEHLANTMKLTVPQTRWRLRCGVERGLITRKWFDTFKYTQDAQSEHLTEPANHSPTQKEGAN